MFRVERFIELGEHLSMVFDEHASNGAALPGGLPADETGARLFALESA